MSAMPPNAALASPEAFWARVKQKLAGRTFKDVERGSTLKYHMLDTARRRNSLLKESDARALANYLGVSLDWLSQGAGPEAIGPTQEEAAMASVISRLPQEDAVLLLGIARVFARANGIEIPPMSEEPSDPSTPNAS